MAPATPRLPRDPRASRATPPDAALRRAASAALLLASAGLLAPVPAAAEYAPGADRLAWFLVSSDTHIGTGGDRDVENLSWLTREAYVATRPDRVILTGDLTDATAGDFFIPWNQQEDEWQEYRALLQGSGMTPDTLIDVPGNHDQYGSKGMPEYLTYSIQGAATGAFQHSLRLEGPDGGVHVLALCTAGNDGALPPADRAGLDAGELQFAQKALEDHADAAGTLVFGHHPQDDFRDGRDELGALLKASGALLYMYGHTHKHESFFRDGTLHYNLDSLGKADSNHLALVSVDGGSLAVRAYDAGAWPLVLITAPADTGLGGGNPRAHSVPPGWASCPVRALVAGDRPAEAVRFQVDDRPWVDLQASPSGVWEGTFDSTGLAEGRHSLTVQALPWKARDHVISFRVGPTACRNGSDDDWDGLTDWPDDPNCPSPLGNDEAAPLPPDPDPGPGDLPSPGDAAEGPADFPADLPVETPAEAPPEAVAEAPADEAPEAVAEAAPPDEPTPPEDPPDAGPAGDVPLPPRDAAAEAGADTAFDAGPCLEGSLRCRLDTVERCTAAGTWEALLSCAASGATCREGACVKGKGGGCHAGPGAPPQGALPPLAALALLAALARLARGAARHPRRCP